ncbi:MAG: hypothetical protein UY85_C0084G0004 [Candidatus Peribacteria bacterium GW2011_GWB1_54_5]|nr:MAG: hypothetical protein UY85_C0084G0004 [Candidatus Peribacteria bacterium GW2011_GWB1_54_5]
MMMLDRADFALQSINSRYCRYCVDKDGMLQTPQERKERLTKFLMEDERLSEDVAEKKAVEQMRKMPAWKGKI